MAAETRKSPSDPPSDSPPERELLEAARAVRKRAWAPYSGFRVGAALVGDDGRVFTGCNVENASFGLTICAERAAAARAVAEGCTAFRTLVLVTGSEEPVHPCGACRQFLAEFGLELAVVAYGRTAEPARATLGELLPGAFRLEGRDG